MERKYRTYNQGIAAYLVMRGVSIIRVIPGTHKKTGKAVKYVEFDTGVEEGRAVADEFYNGRAHGNLKDFCEAQYTVRTKLYES